MTDDREPFREARAAWKAKHHEQRLENATYTAAEVKVLTEVAMRLGRKEAGEEMADFRKLLAPIDMALTMGSGMTTANLALDDLCLQLGVDRNSLNPTEEHW